MTWIRVILMLACTLSAFSPLQAQTGGRQDAMNIINNLPAGLHAKVQALAQLLDQSIKEKKLTEAEVQQGMMSGHLGEKLKAVNPEAGHLLDEIGRAMARGEGPSEESLMPLLQGLGISPQ